MLTANCATILAREALPKKYCFCLSAILPNVVVLLGVAIPVRASANALLANNFATLPCALILAIALTNLVGSSVNNCPISCAPDNALPASAPACFITPV